LRCTARARAVRGAARARWLIAGTLAIAITGIWVMHFIAMLGFTIPGQTIRYNVPVTIASMAIAVISVGIGTFIVGFSREGTRSLVLGGVFIGIGVAAMHYLGMGAIRVHDSLTYNPVLVAASIIIAVVAGTAALWAALRLSSIRSTLVASLIMGVAVSGMHYTGMAALEVHSAPGLVVSTSATASAAAFLLPLILGLSCVGFIFSAIIAVSPTASEMIEEAALMERISQTARNQQAPQHAARQDRPYFRQGGPDEQAGSLFRPHRPSHGGQPPGGAR
jgi:NO-binding membrane sensor protein with MHYT domain